MDLLFLTNHWYLVALLVVALVLMFRQALTKRSLVQSQLAPVIKRLKLPPNSYDGHPITCSRGRWDWQSDESGVLILYSWNKDTIVRGESKYGVEFTLQWPSGSSTTTVTAKLYYIPEDEEMVVYDGQQRHYEDDYKPSALEPALREEIRHLPDLIGTQPYYKTSYQKRLRLA